MWVQQHSAAASTGQRIRTLHLLRGLILPVWGVVENALAATFKKQASRSPSSGKHRVKVIRLMAKGVSGPEAEPEASAAQVEEGKADAAEASQKGEEGDKQQKDEKVKIKEEVEEEKDEKVKKEEEEGEEEKDEKVKKEEEEEKVKKEEEEEREEEESRLVGILVPKEAVSAVLEGLKLQQEHVNRYSAELSKHPGSPGSTGGG